MTREVDQLTAILEYGIKVSLPEALEDEVVRSYEQYRDQHPNRPYQLNIQPSSPGRILLRREKRT